MATASVNIPDLRDLIIPHEILRHDPERLRQAASNVIGPLDDGVEAVGELLWWASQHEDFPFDRNLIGKTGMLLQLLAKLQIEMGSITANAHYYERQGEREFVDVPVVGPVPGEAEQ